LKLVMFVVVDWRSSCTFVVKLKEDAELE